MSKRGGHRQVGVQEGGIMKGGQAVQPTQSLGTVWEGEIEIRVASVVRVGGEGT